MWLNIRNVSTLLYHDMHSTVCSGHIARLTGSDSIVSSITVQNCSARKVSPKICKLGVGVFDHRSICSLRNLLLTKHVIVDGGHLRVRGINLNPVTLLRALERSTIIILGAYCVSSLTTSATFTHRRFFHAYCGISLFVELTSMLWMENYHP